MNGTDKQSTRLPLDMVIRGDNMRILYLPGNGEEYYLDVDYLADVAIKGSYCAFCLADPCNEKNERGTHIHRYAGEKGDRFIHCPMCGGRSS